MGLNGWFDSKRPDGLQGVTMNLTDIEQQPWGRFTMFKDPDGNGWILRQRPA